MTYRPLLPALAVLLALAGPGRAQDTKEDAAHGELRKLKAELTAAVNKGDLDAVLSYLDKDVVVTWLNGEVSNGPDGVRKYFEKTTKGPNRVVESFTTAPEVAALTHLYGGTGVAYGSSKDTFRLTDGSDFTIETLWTATLVKDGPAWKIASFHASANVFDNAVLWLYLRRASWWVGGIAALVGVLLGLLLGLFLFRRRGNPDGSGAPRV